MISLVAVLIFIVCLGIILNDLFFKKSQVVASRVKVVSVKVPSDSNEGNYLGNYAYGESPKIEDKLVSKPNRIKEALIVATLSLFFLMSFISFIYLFASSHDLRTVLDKYYDLEKFEQQNPLSGSLYLKVFRFFTAGVMDIAFCVISFYIWFMVHRRAFRNRKVVDFTFLRQLDYGLFFAGLYVFFLAITNFIQIDRHLQSGKSIDESFLISFSTLNSIFLIVSCIYFGHNFIFFKNVKNKGLKVVTSTIIISAVVAFACSQSDINKSAFMNYFSNFDRCLSVLALAVFSIGVSISFYNKGYMRFLPAFSLFAGFCFILNQISQFPTFHTFIYGIPKINLDGRPIIMFCNRILGYTSEIFIGVLFLLIGKTWSSAYENDINRAVVGIYKQILEMEENNKIKSLLQRIYSLEQEKINLLDAKISLINLKELQKNLESEIALYKNSYMSNRDFARCLIVVENNRMFRQSQHIKQPDQIAIPRDIKKFITSEYEIEKEILKVGSNLN